MNPALQTVSAQGEGEGHSGAAQAGGFSLNAGVAIKPGQRARLKRVFGIEIDTCAHPEIQGLAGVAVV